MSFAPNDASFLRLVARWIRELDTPSLLPKRHSAQIEAIAKEVERQREVTNA